MKKLKNISPTALMLVFPLYSVLTLTTDDLDFYLSLSICVFGVVTIGVIAAIKYVFSNVKEFRANLEYVKYVTYIISIMFYWLFVEFGVLLSLTCLVLSILMVVSHYMSETHIIPYQMRNCSEREKDFLEDVTQKYIMSDYFERVSFIVPTYDIPLTSAYDCLSDMMKLYTHSIEIKRNSENCFVVIFEFNTFDEFEKQKKEFLKTIKYDIL